MIQNQKQRLPHSPQSRLKRLCEKNKTVWMGIVNLSPFSFSQTKEFENVLKHAESLIESGAHILDIGAVPTNPNIQNALIDPVQELGILYPVLLEFKKQFDSNVLISVDTYSPTVAYALARENLIHIVNDVYGGRKFEKVFQNSEYEAPAINLMDVVSKFSLGYVLMHMSGELDTTENRQPTTGNRQPTTDNRKPVTDNRQPITDNRQPKTDNRQPKTDNRKPVTDNRQPITDNRKSLDPAVKPRDDTKPRDDMNSMVFEFFVERKCALEKKGIPFCVFDPGIGGGRFGKNLEQNLALLSKEFLNKLSTIGFPILVGLSRKSFLGELYPKLSTPQSRDKVSKEWEMRCFDNGVKIIRTHTLRDKFK